MFGVPTLYVSPWSNIHTIDYTVKNNYLSTSSNSCKVFTDDLIWLTGQYGVLRGGTGAERKVPHVHQQLYDGAQRTQHRAGTTQSPE